MPGPHGAVCPRLLAAQRVSREIVGGSKRDREPDVRDSCVD